MAESIPFDKERYNNDKKYRREFNRLINKKDSTTKEWDRLLNESKIENLSDLVSFASSLSNQFKNSQEIYESYGLAMQDFGKLMNRALTATTGKEKSFLLGMLDSQLSLIDEIHEAAVGGYSEVFNELKSKEAISEELKKRIK